MEIDTIDIKHYAIESEDSKHDLILKYFKISKDDNDILGIENIPKIIEAGFVAICLSGECELMLNREIYHFKAGQICVCFTATLIQTIWTSNDFECNVLATNIESLHNINIPSVSELFLIIRNNPCITLSDEEINILSTNFEYIRLNYNRKHPYQIEIASKLLSVLCYEIAAIYQRDTTTTKHIYSYKDTIFRNFIHLLSSKFQTEHRVAYYAKELSITPKYLSSIIKDVSQKSAVEWINDFILRNAKTLLTTTTLTTQQISDQLNFPNSSFFTQYFKRITGKTPKEFRHSDIL